MTHYQPPGLSAKSDGDKLLHAHFDLKRAKESGPPPAGK